MAVEHVGSDDHHRTRFDVAASKFVSRNRCPADRRERWIEADRLLDHGPGLDETFGEAFHRAVDLALGFCHHPLLPVWRL